MQTFLPDDFKNTPDGIEADSIIRSCVHCGFCNATCPTYQLLGDELDSPRGRIYLIKNLLEGKESTKRTLKHLDRCLTCRSCETHCPSGVKFGNLLDIGRQKIKEKVQRPFTDRLYRLMLRKVLPRSKIFYYLLKFGQLLRPVLPAKLKNIVPKKCSVNDIIIHSSNEREMILFEGCVQPSLSPNTNISASYILGRLGINTKNVSGETCCGAIDYHMAESKSAIKYIKTNIDMWWPLIERSVEAIITTASGCGVTIKEYGYILRNDPEYAEKAQRVSEITKDIAEVISTENIQEIKINAVNDPIKLAFQCPCTLQHGQKLKCVTENLLNELGFSLTNVPDSHMCCGSAGVYSLLQTEIANDLKVQKIRALESENPSVIGTANIGCQIHLQQGTAVPVKHWIELLADRLLEKS